MGFAWRIELNERVAGAKTGGEDMQILSLGRSETLVSEEWVTSVLPVSQRSSGPVAEWLPGLSSRTRLNWLLLLQLQLEKPELEKEDSARRR